MLLEYMIVLVISAKTVRLLTVLESGTRYFSVTDVGGGREYFLRPLPETDSRVITCICREPQLVPQGDATRYLEADLANWIDSG